MHKQGTHLHIGTLTTLRSRDEIDEVFKKGEKQVSPFFVSYVLRSREAEAEPRYLVIASRKVGKAVDRNRAKRLLRALVTHCKDYFPQCSAERIILVARKRILDKKSTDLVPIFVRMLGNITTNDRNSC